MSWQSTAAVLWVVTPCGLIGGYPCFGGTYSLRPEGCRTQKTVMDVCTTVKTWNLISWPNFGTNFTKQNSSWRSDTRSAANEILSLLRSPSIITVFTTAIQSYSGPVESGPHLYTRFIKDPFYYYFTVLVSEVICLLPVFCLYLCVHFFPPREADSGISVHDVAKELDVSFLCTSASPAAFVSVSTGSKDDGRFNIHCHRSAKKNWNNSCNLIVFFFCLHTKLQVRLIQGNRQKWVRTGAKKKSKKLDVFWLAERLLTSQERHWSIKIFSSELGEN